LSLSAVARSTNWRNSATRRACASTASRIEAYLLKKLGKVGAVSQPRAAARFGNRGYSIAFPGILKRYLESFVLVYCSAGFTALPGWCLLKERLNWAKLLVIALLWSRPSPP